MSSRIALTTADPAGIGPEICVKAVFTGRVKSPVTLIGDKKLLIQTSEKLGFGSIFPDWVKFEHVPLAHPAVPGQLDVANAPYVVETLRRAAQGAQDGTYSAVVTAPVQKSIIIEAGIPFTGHTEFFQQFAGVDRVVMMLTSGTSQQALRVALVTTHLPLQQIPAAITDEALDKTLAICAHALHQDFGIERPRIAVTGLNPHARKSNALRLRLNAPRLRFIPPNFQVRGRQTRFSCRLTPKTSTASCACTMTRDCPLSSARASGTASTSRLGCLGYAHRSITARH